MQWGFTRVMLTHFSCKEEKKEKIAESSFEWGPEGCGFLSSTDLGSRPIVTTG